jgi:hypothetical protein
MLANKHVYKSKAIQHVKDNANEPIDDLMTSILGNKTEDNKDNFEKLKKEV